MPETPGSEEPLESAYIEELTVQRPGAPATPAQRPGAPATPAQRPGAPATPAVEELSSSALAEDIEDIEAAAAAAGGDALVGSLISGRYRVHELIGEGGMGAVYRGEQVHLRKQVAIKLLRPVARRMPELVARFEREAVAGAHIRHPNVVAAIDFGQLDDASYFLILEYVAGTPLKEVIAAGRLQPARALRVARQIASALEAAHEKGIVHRDVKPQNVLLDAHDQVRLIDFGLAKVDVDLLSQTRKTSGPSPALTSAGEVFGTLSYLAPEALRGMDAVDARADLYALGLVLYEMLTGKHPFDTKNVVERLKQQGPAGPPPLRARAPDLEVPREVEQVVARLMEHDAAFRYQTATDAIAALDEALAAVARAAAAPAAVAAPAAPAALGGTAARGGTVVIGGTAARGGTAAVAAPVSVPAAAAPAAAAARQAGQAAPGAKPAPAWSGPRRTLLAHAHGRAKASGGWVPVAVAVAALATLVIGSGAIWLALRRPEATATAPAPAGAELPPAPAAPTTPPPEPEPPATAPPEDDTSGPRAVRAQLSRAVATRNWVNAARAMLALAEADQEMLLSRGLREEIVSTVAGIAFEEGNPAADQVFDLLTNKLGTGGLDVLLDVVRARGGTKAARRASEILEQPAVMARATPALRVTYAFRKATCNGKRALFGRAAAEGDERTLFELQVLHGARCRRADPCCFRDDKAIAEAIQQLKERLGT
ncbi:protein kinase domain-containing protein [Sorangium sp. So ce513]|uniref:serine/threonine-protein kinase n=1 Tax=Sorangium sp. So ce513 TaxID=3133315 RepID=UPI003F610781